MLCADDYAMAPGVSRGILEALDAGALSATSAMTNGPHWPEHAGALLPFVGRADLGLHLSLTCGRALTAMPTLAPDGALPDLATLLRRARRGLLPVAEIEEEIEAQAAAWRRTSRRPDCDATSASPASRASTSATTTPRCSTATSSRRARATS